MSALANTVWLGLIATLIAVFVRSRGWSVALPLLGCGALIGMLPWGPSATDEPELIGVLVLAPLVFGEALSSSYVDIKSVRRPVLALAIGLVIISTVAIGGLTALLISGIPLALALALGAILAPTDLVVVASSARRARLPPRLVTILEGESLLNDGTGLTALRVAIMASVAGTVTAGEAAVLLAQTVAVGTALGLLGGSLLVLLLRKGGDPIGHGAILLVAPLPLYVTTEAAGGSGILALVLAGLMAAHAAYGDPDYQGRLEVTSLWRQITSVMQAIAFFFLGTELPALLVELPASQRNTLWWAVPVIVIGLLAVRMAVILGGFGLARLAGLDSPAGWRGAALIGWAGARGPVSALAAFSLPLLTIDGAPLAYRDMVIAAALMAIALTLLISTTLVPVARLLRVQSTGSEAVQRRLRRSMAEAALNTLEAANREAAARGEPLPGHIVEALRAATDHRIGLMRRQTAAQRDQKRVRALQIAMLEAEQDELVRLRSEEELPEAAVRPLLAELDRRIALIRGPGEE
jgi:NhaP-type Na+/H+ or K+/H+ antiporter